MVYIYTIYFYHIYLPYTIDQQKLKRLTQAYIYTIGECVLQLIMTYSKNGKIHGTKKKT